MTHPYGVETIRVEAAAGAHEKSAGLPALFSWAPGCSSTPTMYGMHTAI